MRDIKFRAWNRQYGEWCKNCELIFITVTENSTSFGNLEIQQFTGLRDKNGKEIYEGDVLSVYEPPVIEEDGALDKHNYEVKWCGEDGYPAFDLLGWADEEVNALSAIEQSGDWECEVIGNIYQNPDLLEN